MTEAEKRKKRLAEEDRRRREGVLHGTNPFLDPTSPLNPASPVYNGNTYDPPSHSSSDAASASDSASDSSSDSGGGGD